MLAQVCWIYNFGVPAYAEPSDADIPRPSSETPDPERELLNRVRATGEVA
jgi:hypothetical protein